ncbi:hypothetical protein ACP275_07G107800 [Erythranthe tilingii]
MKRLTVISVPWVFCKSLIFVLSSTTVRRPSVDPPLAVIGPPEFRSKQNTVEQRRKGLFQGVRL